MSCFSTLSSDDAFNVLRHLSDNPKSDSWLYSLPDGMLNLLADNDGPMAHQLENMFGSMAVRNAFSLRMLFPKPGYLGISPHLYFTSSVLMRFGGSLKKVDVDEECFATKFNESKLRDILISLYSDVNRHCRDLKSFSVTPYHRAGMDWIDVVAKNSGSLEELNVCCQYCCHSVPRIALPGIPLLELKVLCLEYFHVNDVDDLVTFLSRSGGKLVDITINWLKASRTEWSMLVDALRTSCRDVQKISLKTSEEKRANVLEAEEARLYISYGTQLREVGSLNLELDLCREVLARCPNVQCAWNPLSNIDCNFERFVLFAPHIHTVSLDSNLSWLHSSSTRGRCEAALSSFKNLKKIQFDNEQETCVRALNIVFAKRHHMLDELSLSLPAVTRDLVLLLTPSLRCLRKLSVDCRGIRLDGIYWLFEACAKVEHACFMVESNISVANAVDCVAKIVDVAWTKDTLRELRILIQAFLNDEWDDDSKDQFNDNVAMVVQKMRLRRCEFEVNFRLYFQEGLGDMSVHVF